MNLYRIKLWPDSGWRTPWQADTLFGMLCGALARQAGGGVLQEAILQPALAGKPPFVLSDVFPGDLLPIPLAVRLRDLPQEIGKPDQRKKVKKARWVTPQSFQAAQSGGVVNAEELLADQAWQVSNRQHVTLDRISNTSGEGALHTEQDYRLRPQFLNPNSTTIDQEKMYLSAYLRVQPGWAERVCRLFRLLALSGFGADTSQGMGQFRAASEMESVDWLDAAGDSANGCVCLSTFQPAEPDPTEGCWELMTKYGKLGPDFGIDNIFKRPLVLLRPGACFVGNAKTPFLGRALPMYEFLEESASAELESHHQFPVHAAFGLTVPLKWTL